MRFLRWIKDSIYRKIDEGVYVSLDGTGGLHFANKTKEYTYKMSIDDSTISRYITKKK